SCVDVNSILSALTNQLLIFQDAFSSRFSVYCTLQLEHSFRLSEIYSDIKFIVPHQTTDHF
ncbi:MAG: hypothetical protein M3Z01_06700, partial [Thermoproteota archaeon]|nr:hypothetical protein [Thermoproteota archaeon]